MSERRGNLGFELAFLLFSGLVLFLDYYFVTTNFEPFPGRDRQLILLGIFLLLFRMTFAIDYGWTHGMKYLKVVLIVLALVYWAYVVGQARAYLVWEDFNELESYVKPNVDIWAKRQVTRRMNDLMIFVFMANLVIVPFFVVAAIRSIWRQLRREEEKEITI